jgi:hypothetical protein
MRLRKDDTLVGTRFRFTKDEVRDRIAFRNRYHFQSYQFCDAIVKMSILHMSEFWQMRGNRNNEGG